MSDGGSGPAAEGRRTRLRRFLGGRSGVQRIGALAAVAVLATAPFGGLAEAEDDPVPLRLGETYDLGQFEVRLDKVLSLPDLEPAVAPDPGNRLLVLDITATNPTDEAQPVRDLTTSWSATGLDAQPWAYSGATELLAFTVDDATAMTGHLNPGQTMRLALVIQFSAGWDLGDLELSMYGSSFVEDPFTLTDGYWVADEVLARGPVDVEVEP